MRKYIFGRRYFVRKGIHWNLGNAKRINFWHDNKMEESPLVEKIPQVRRSTITYDIKCSYIVNGKKNWKIRGLSDLLLRILWKRSSLS